MRNLKKIGLYFGTFNPIHVGHLIIANHLAENTNLDEVWMVITPQSPFKKKKNLLDNHHRLELVYRAVESFDKIKPCAIEFGMPTPNYTAKTLAVLSEKYPEKQFSLIMGEDNLKTFHKWKNYEHILSEYQIYTCPRVGEKEIPEAFVNHPNIQFTDTPIIEISATLIRNSIRDAKDVRPLLPNEVWKYIDEMNFYRS